MSNADEDLRIAARTLLNERVAMAKGRHDPATEARAWDRFARALDAAEVAALGNTRRVCHCPERGDNYHLSGDPGCIRAARPDMQHEQGAL